MHVNVKIIPKITTELFFQSMGKSLTFEQSVREAIELQKNFKCKNPVCETQTWKIKHELDLALMKIDRMSRLLR